MPSRTLPPLLATLFWAAAAPAVHAQAQAYDIPAQPLDATLAQIARQGRVQLILAPALAEGRQAPAVRGTFEVGAAMLRALDGSGLEAVREGPSTLVVRRVPGAAGTLGEVRVTAQAERDVAALGQAQRVQREGTAADGYRTDTITSVGMLGGLRALDTPYAITTLPRELLQNLQAQSPDDLYRINPTTLSQTPQISGWAPMVKIRGFNSYDRAEDGLRRSYGFATSLEDKERVEVLSGLSGFLYGAAAPGGMVNYVNKRPTPERLNSITVGNYGGSQAYVHGDFGGPIDTEGRFGYRLNLVHQNGGTAVDDQEIRRTLASLALDWQLHARARLELNASASNYRMQAPMAYWIFREGVPRIAAPDASRNWGQPWVRDETRSRKWGVRLVVEPTDQLTLRLAHLRDAQERPMAEHTMNSVRSTDAYHQIRTYSGATRSAEEASQLLADLRLDTGPIAHKITAGYYGSTQHSWSTTANADTGWLGPYGFGAPTHVPRPDWAASAGGAQYDEGGARNRNWVLGDLLRWGERWSAIVGMNHSRIETRWLGADGALSEPAYARSRTSPNLSLMFKPQPWLTAYATYIEGLEQGGVAPLTADNSLAVMPPMVSRQKELGVKAEAGGLLWSAALFQIDKAYEYTNAQNVYGQDGTQRHRGLELSAIGKASAQWTVLGGLTWLDAGVHGGDNDGKAPMNTPRIMAKLYAEYALQALPGLSLSGGIYHVGKQWAIATNTARLPSFVTLDAGVRYATQLAGKPLSLRLAVSNLADRDHWLNSYYLGTPRSVAFSAQMAF